VKIEYVQATSATADRHRSEFIATYQEAFAGKPYFETYTEAEVLHEAWDPCLRHGVIFLALDANVVIGLGCAIPLIQSPEEIQGFLRPKRGLEGFPVEFSDVWYMADVGVRTSHKHQGIGTQLIACRLRYIRALGCQYYVLRTDAEESNSKQLYLNHGAQLLSGIQDVSQSGQVQVNQSRSSKRIYLFGQCEKTAASAEAAAVTRVA